MPIGAFKLNTIARGVAVAASVRTTKTIITYGNAQVDTAQSKFGGASALFDGTDDWLDAIDSSGDWAFGTGSDFTIEGWLRFSAVDNTRVLWSLYDGATFRASFYLSSGQLTFYSAGTGAVSLGDFPSTGVWYHFAITRASGTTKFWYNGVETGSTASSWTATFTRLILGGESPSGTAISNDYAGHMDEIRISNTARYTAGFTPSTSAFVNDANTVLLIHADGADASTTFTDDNPTSSAITQALNTAMSTSSDNWRGNDMAYMGNDSQGRPVFCTGFNKVTTQYPTLIMFRLNLTDLTITKGSEYTIESVVAVYVSVSSERDGAGLRTSSGFTDYGYAVWARNAANTGSRAAAFSYNLDNLTLTLGTSIAVAGTSGVQGAGHYIGNLRVAATTNGGNNGNFLVQNWATRTGGTTTLTKNTGADNVVLGNIGQGGGHNMRGMASDRWINVPQTGNNGHGWYSNAMRTNSTSMVGRDYIYNTVFPSDAVFNSEAKIAQLNNTDRFITACQGAFTNGTVYRIKAQAGTVTWNTGSTQPTITMGSVVELETNANYRFGLCEGKVDGEAYFIFCDNNDGLKLKYKKLTVSTNTITQSAYTTLSTIGNTQGYYVIDATRMVQIGTDYYMLLGMRNSTTGTVDVAVVKNPT